MRMALSLGPWQARDLASTLAQVRVAEELGFSAAWAAEAWGYDVPALLGWLAPQTTRIELGAAVMQIPARSAAATAMTAATLDAVSGGRFRLGLGVSGPQVAEGWHGVGFADPLGRTREYVEVVRKALRHERLTYTGRHIQLPLPGGPGTPLRLATAPVRRSLQIYLAALGPRNLRLAGEIADGWHAVLFAPQHAAGQLAAVSDGRARADRTLADFDVVSHTPLAVAADVEAAADLVRDHVALYVGGMGSREQNFYHRLVSGMGFGTVADRVQQLYLGGDRRAAAAALPLELIDAVTLLGPAERVADRMGGYAWAGVTTLSVQPFGPDPAGALRSVAAAATAAGTVDLSQAST